ncbi:hypothetical protein HPB47_004059 [Ixodes persulcatus]|uniref:Uncharacterized protein n=1 Tax=Ixodes persulcatus TaxID=34615 RepID=A0AC60PGR8_IXOPE|nr:hypothetical protein HPB47_004059 [Ixodes persulcatus]
MPRVRFSCLSRRAAWVTERLVTTPTPSLPPQRGERRFIARHCTGALIWTLGEKVGEKSGGCDWPTPHLTLAPANNNRQISRRLSRQVSRLGPQKGCRSRPRKTDKEEERLIVAAAVADPFSGAQEIRDELQLTISCHTIRRCLKEAGLHNCVAAQKPHLTDKQPVQQRRANRSRRGNCNASPLSTANHLERSRLSCFLVQVLS